MFVCVSDQLAKSFPTSEAVLAYASEQTSVKAEVAHDQPGQTASRVLGPQVLPLSRPELRDSNQCPYNLEETLQSLTSMLNMLKTQVNIHNFFLC